MSCTWKVYDCVGEGLKWGLSKGGEQLANGGVEAFAKAIGDATAETLKSLNGVWMNINVSDPAQPTTDIHSVTSWIVGYVAVGCLLIAAVKMALDRRGQPMKQAFMGMWKVLLVGGLAVPVVQALTNASDTYAKDIYEKSDLGDQASSACW
jgi:phosphotransferase system  glucose/maltose/N-acetylglucosamine-specific IIC component